MSGLLEKFVYADKDLTLQQQADLVDKFLDMIYSMLWATFPDLKLQTSGSVLYNEMSIQVNEAVKLKLLPKKKLEEFLNECSSCGRELDPSIKQWRLESIIREGKEYLKHELVTTAKDGVS